MRAAWEALDARARGLASHLLSEDQLARVARATDVTELARELRDTPYARFAPPGVRSAAAVETVITRSIADRIATLARLAVHSPHMLAPVFLEMEARNVRAILRGTLGEQRGEQRIAGTIPTPGLDRRALETLARCDSPGSVAATLVAWEHPLGSALLFEASRARPDPFLLEAALGRSFATEAIRSARMAGKHMRGFVEEALDALNIVGALLLSEARSEGKLVDFFIDGGSCLSRDDFVRAASAASRPQCATVLARATKGTVYARLLQEPPASPTNVSERILLARIRRLGRDGLREPVGPLPVLLFFLRLRREARLLRRATWSTSLTARSAT